MTPQNRIPLSVFADAMAVRHIICKLPRSLLLPKVLLPLFPRLRWFLSPQSLLQLRSCFLRWFQSFPWEIYLRLPPQTPTKRLRFLMSCLNRLRTFLWKSRKRIEWQNSNWNIDQTYANLICALRNRRNDRASRTCWKVFESCQDFFDSSGPNLLFPAMPILGFQALPPIHWSISSLPHDLLLHRSKQLLLFSSPATMNTISTSPAMWRAIPPHMTCVQYVPATGGFRLAYIIHLCFKYLNNCKVFCSTGQHARQYMDVAWPSALLHTSRQ